MNQKTILKKSDKIRIFLNSPFMLILSILLSIGIFMNTIHILISSKQLFVDLLGMIFPILFVLVYGYLIFKMIRYIIQKD